METTVLDERAGRWAPLLNLALPGGGLILIGSVWSGLLGGLLFVACANFAVAAVLLFPDDFSRTSQALGIGLAGGSYVGLQLRLAQSVRGLRDRGAAAWRGRLLRETQEFLACGEAVHALEAIQPLAQQAQRDLLVAYRLAQALTAAGDVPRSLAAWRQVHKLDRHGLYRQQVRENERNLGRTGTL